LLDYLNTLFEKPVIELNYGSDFELLVAVILSAQCTDVRVNEVTKGLFAKYNTPVHFATLDETYLQQIIRPCGLSKTKAKNLIATARALIDRHGGQVPSTLGELVALAGVGQKTANVVLYAAFGLPAIAVDTHVFRVSNRLGLSASISKTGAKNFKKCEADLRDFFKKENWGQAHHLLVLFGRYYCKAVKPLCVGCKIKEYCIHYKTCAGK